MNVVESTSSCALVPIFSNKKRRIKQALYSNPSTSSTSSTDNFQSSSSSIQINNEGFSAEEVGRPLNVMDKKRPNKNFRAVSFGKKTSFGKTEFDVPQSPPKRNQTNVMANSQLRNKKPNAQKTIGHHAPNAHLMPKPVPISNGNISKQGLKVDQQHNKKQENAKDHQENSPRVLTTSIKNLMDWDEFREKMTLIFEIYGTLQSAVSTGMSNNSKTFLLKDDTGNVRCTFWEMDRILPRLIRGKSYRVIGSMDRMNRTFNCVTVRPSTLAELHSAKISIACAQSVMQGYISTFKED